MDSLVITNYCKIKNRTVILNGEELPQNNDSRVDQFFDDVYSNQRIEYPRFHKMDRLSKAGFLAAEIMLMRSTVLSEVSSEEVAIVLSNQHSSLDTDVRYQEAARTVPSPALFVYTLPNIVTGEIAIRHQFRGENAFFISERFDPDMLCNYVQQVFSAGMTRACVSGWIDVLDEHHDVLLYLVEKRQDVGYQPHTAEQISLLYQN